jgi:hypothetical protein
MNANPIPKAPPEKGIRRVFRVMRASFGLAERWARFLQQN